MATWGELEKAGTKWRDLEEMTWGELEEFCVINPKTKQIPDDMEVSFVPMQSVSDTGAVQTDEVRKASEVKKGFTFFEEGDVLFAKITPCMENGKGGIARGLKNGVGFGSTEFHVLHPAPEKVSSEWLYYLTSWDEFRKQCARNMTGSAGQKRVPKSYLEHYKVHLPSLEEQRRIAAVLDKVSDLIAKRREQLDKLDELVKARFVEMFGDPEFNLRNWPIVSLSDVCTVGSSKRIYQSEQTFDGVPFLRISDLNHLIDTGDFCPSLFISEEKYQELQQHGQVPIEGDILVTSRGTLGRCYIIKTTDRFYFQDGMISWISNLSNEITSLFIAYLFDMQSIKRQIESMQAGSTVSYLSIDMIKRLKIMLPDRNLQKQFGAFVDQTNKSKLTIQQSLDKLETLKKALMQRYWG